MSLITGVHRFQRLNVIRTVNSRFHRYFSSDLLNDWQHSVNLYKDNTAIIQDDLRVSYKELDDRINSICFMFENVYNLKRGDKIMNISLIRMDDISIFMACAKMGLLYIGMNPSFTSKQVSNISQIANPSLIISEPPFLPNTQSVKSSIPRLALSEEFDANNWIAQEYDSPHSHQVDSSQITNSDPFQVVFTSGTTGTPKGVIYSQNSITKLNDFFASFAPNSESKASLCLVPLFGAIAISQRMSVLRHGSAVIYPNKYMQGNVEHIHDLCEYKHDNISHTALFGKTLSDIYSLNRPFSRMDTVFYGGDFIPLKTVAGAKLKLFPKHTKFVSGYGTSEFLAATVVDPKYLNDIIDKFDGSNDIQMPAGAPINEFVKIKIAEDGEVLVKKEDDSGMIGYLGNDELTKEVKSEDGWFKTGDLGYIDDENGLLYLQGRKKDIIKLLNGRFIVPMDIESVLMTHPKVNEVAVVGYPNCLIDDTLSGEVPVAFVSLNEDAEHENIKEELMKMCREEQGDEDYQIKQIFFMMELPKTPNRKLSKATFRELIKNGEFVLKMDAL